jgi:hypothetical protein
MDTPALAGLDGFDFPEYDFPESHVRDSLPKINLDEDGVKLFQHGIVCEPHNKYIPDGTIIDFPAYQNLLKNMRTALNNKAEVELQNPYQNPQFKTLLDFCNNNIRHIRK